MSDEMNVKIGLFSMRIGISTVFLAWTIDKIVAYEHNSLMLKGYYKLEVGQTALLLFGIAELIVVLLFIAGMYKRFTYGILLVAHLVTTIASSWRLLPPYELHQLLYFGSLPMLGACIGLYLMRDKDTLFTFQEIKVNN